MSYLLRKSLHSHGNLFELNCETHFFSRIQEGNITLVEKQDENYFFQVDVFDGGHVIRSDYPVYVNGVKISCSHKLNDNDEIEIENELFRFLASDNSLYGYKDGSIFFCQSDRFIVSEKHLQVSENEFANGKHESIGHDFFRQLYLSKNLNDFISNVFSVLTSFKMSRIAFFIWNESNGTFEKRDPLGGGGEKGDFMVSKTVLSYMLVHKKSVLCQDLLKDDRFKDSESLISQWVHSIMAAPLLFKNCILGFIYVDTTDHQNRFNEGDFQNFNFLIPQIAFLLDHFVEKQRFDQLNQNFEEIMINHLKLVGGDVKFKETLRISSRVAKTNVGVILSGESGSGKELIARYIHQHSSKKHNEMICVNCAAISETLFESEFFGHVKGAFTGALEHKNGYFELANDSSLFLDEVGELPLGCQAKLLRVLQESEFYKVGGTRPLKVKIRIISATNADLKKMMKEGRFREDLYYRLNGIQIRIPPLRERLDDVRILSEFFIKKYSFDNKVPVKILQNEAVELLKRYSWPGNIRELKHKIERAMILSESDEVTPDDFIDCVDDVCLSTFDVQDSCGKSFKESVRDFEMNYLMELLQKTKGNISVASQESGLERSYLYQKLKKYNIQPESFR